MDWYCKLLTNEGFSPALMNTLVVDAAVAFISVAVGLLALGLAKVSAARAQSLIDILSAPMMLLVLIIGIALLSFFVRVLAIPLGLPTVILGQLVVTVPFVIASCTRGFLHSTGRWSSFLNSGGSQ